MTGTSGTVRSGTVPLHEQPEIYQRRWFLLGVMCLSLVMVVMSVSGLNVALPSMQRSLDASATDLQWMVDSYAIVFAGLLLTAGAIGDRFGRKRALVTGMAIFGLGSLIGSFADSSELVIVARSVSGIGAAFVMPATLSILTAVFPPAERTRAIAVWAGFAGAGGVIGPLIVGLLLTGWWFVPSFWWGSAFVVNVVVAAIVIIAIVLFAPESKDDEEHPLDPLGAALSLVGLAALLYGIIEGPERGWGDGYVVVAFVVAIATLVGFVAWELKATHPMLPMSFFRHRRFSTGAGLITAGFMIMFGFFFLMTQYFQFVRGYSPLKAAVATLPFAAVMIVVAPRSDALVKRFGLAKVNATGFVLIGLGFLVLGVISTSTSYLGLLPAFILMPAGMALTTAPSTGAIMSSVPLNKAGVGSAVNDTTRELGGALGIAVLGSIVASAYREHFDPAGLPAELAGPAGESVGAAIGVASNLPPQQGQELIAQAGTAFTNAFNTAMYFAAGMAAAVAVVVLVIERRAVDTAPVLEAEAVDA